MLKRNLYLIVDKLDKLRQVESMLSTVNACLMYILSHLYSTFDGVLSHQGWDDLYRV